MKKVVVFKKGGTYRVVTPYAIYKSLDFVGNEGNDTVFIDINDPEEKVYIKTEDIESVTVYK